MIGVGDKVVITFGNCAHRIKAIGEMSVVAEVEVCGSHCAVCGAQSQLATPHAILRLGDWFPCYVPIAWLRKLDDPDVAETRELERVVDA